MIWYRGDRCLMTPVAFLSFEQRMYVPALDTVVVAGIRKLAIERH